MLDDATIEFIAQHREEDVRTLALQAGRYPTVDMREAVTQIEGWQQAREKLPTWAAVEGIIYPPKISMEQCSSEKTAKYKAKQVKGKRFADLTGGFGIDFSYMARNFNEAFYIERNKTLCDIATANFSLLGLEDAKVMNGNSEELFESLPHLDWIFVDPARRDGDGRKVVALSDCEPNVVELDPLSKADMAMIKCSPMLDITMACRQLQHVSSVHIVSVNNECKELLIILNNGDFTGFTTHCVNILKDSTQIFSFTQDEEDFASTSYCSEVGKYLYEPNASVQKAGSPKSLSSHYHVDKLHPNSHLYTSNEHIHNFPGRIFEVVEVLGFSKADIKSVQSLGKANITVRNFPESVQLLRKRLKLTDGGENYIFATTLNDDSKALILCKKA
ncbi:MAG: RsmD family RNA methyltransferase [Bacteroidaceae bacterium]|nr:RsmD family RNA methyltransferase [Bacteroidaceae bacterium]